MEIKTIGNVKVGIIDEFAIGTDEYNFNLYKIKTVKKDGAIHEGEQYLYHYSYHPTLERAVNAILTEKERRLWPDVDAIIKSHNYVLSKFDELRKIKRSKSRKSWRK